MAWPKGRKGLKGAPARNAAKTHCKHGHEFTPENTILKAAKTASGQQRACRKCKNARLAARRRAQGRPERRPGASRPEERRIFRITRDDLRRLVDVVWNEATESTAVPSTKWADKLIDKALTVPNGER